MGPRHIWTELSTLSMIPFLDDTNGPLQEKLFPLTCHETAPDYIRWVMSMRDFVRSIQRSEMCGPLLKSSLSQSAKALPMAATASSHPSLTIVGVWVV